uniref:Uncharacterized protein n=1 Tax=Romanomermis culicivorax TaxID=13658 RepID=A0A915L1B0_ROMCU
MDYIKQGPNLRYSYSRRVSNETAASDDMNLNGAASLGYRRKSRAIRQRVCLAYSLRQWDTA